MMMVMMTLTMIIMTNDCMCELVCYSQAKPDASTAAREKYNLNTHI